MLELGSSAIILYGGSNPLSRMYIKYVGVVCNVLHNIVIMDQYY